MKFNQSNKFAKSLSKLLKGKSKSYRARLENSIDDFKSHIGDKDYLRSVYKNHILHNINPPVWDIHIFQRLILIYQVKDDEVLLLDIGTHRNVLGMESYNILDNDPDFYI